MNYLTVPTRTNTSISSLTFDGNDEAHVIFQSKEGENLFEILITKILNNYTAVCFNSKMTVADKFVVKYMHDELIFGEMESMFYNLQKRVKEAYRKDFEVKENEAQEIPEARKTVETPIPETAPEVKVEKVERTTEYKPEKAPKIGLEAQIFNMVAEGINDDTTTEIINKVVRAKIDELGIVPNQTIVKVKRLDGTTKEAGIVHKKFKTILQCLSAKTNVAIVGPAGSGKTTCVRQVADALDLNFYSKSVSAQTGTHEFFGYQDANGKYVRTLFREAYEFGGVFLLDEFDAGNPNVLAALNQATANGHCPFADGMIAKHDNFNIVMAGNTYGHGATTEYVGRNKIDAATLDRFAFIQFDYDEDFEYQIATNKDWCKEVQAIRKVVAEKKIKTIVSPRATFEGSKLLSIGMSKKEVKDLLIYKGLTLDERKLIG